VHETSQIARTSQGTEEEAVQGTEESDPVRRNPPCSIGVEILKTPFFVFIVSMAVFLYITSLPLSISNLV